jgi:TPR repeat protein
MKTARRLKASRGVWIAALCCGVGSPAASAQTQSPSDANSRESAARPESAIVATDCDRYAASDFDKQSPVVGIPFDKIDPKMAIPACLEAVSKDPDSARLNFELGRAYDADKQFGEAARFFLKAAAANFALAQLNLGSLYFNGQGVDKDYGAAAKWDRLAADQGLAPAQANLGLIYARGQGAPRDDAEAARFLRLAAAQGFAPAENALGDLYAKGQGVERNAVEAMKWYASAAGHGHAAARASLEALIAEGSDNAPARAADATTDNGAPRPPARSDTNAPRYRQAPTGETYPPVKIVVQPPDNRTSNRSAATAIEISPLSPNFSMTGFAVNKGDCRVYIQDPTALLRAGGAAQNISGPNDNESERQSEMEKIALIPPPYDPPVVAKLGQYMTFYVDPSACDVREVEVLVNGFEWKWTPG